MDKGQITLSRSDIARKQIKVLEMIRQDMAEDAKNFDGKPLTGRSCVKYMGYHGAAIASLAEIMQSIISGGLNNGE